MPHRHSKSLMETLAQYSPTCKVDRSLCISTHLIRATDNSPVVGIEAEHTSKKETINLFSDALIWYHHHFNNNGTLRFILGESPSNMHPVLCALATLCHNLQPRVKVQVEIDQVPADLSLPEFSQEEDPWARTLLTRGDMPLPELAVRLSREVGCPSFRWYFTLKARRWSGRVEGLIVCSLSPDGTSGTLGIGAPGKHGAIGQARQHFTELAGQEEIRFNVDNLSDVAKIIKALAKDRQTGVLAHLDPEHHLESRILRGVVPVRLQDSTELEMVQKDHSFQLPTRWHPGGVPKYLDVLMRSGKTPWAVELKVAESFHVRYYRHAICQAVLYREFIRHATSFFPWFERHGLDPTQCRAAIAFPKPSRLNQTAEVGLADIQWLADLFQVKVITLDLA